MLLLKTLFIFRLYIIIWCSTGNL